MKGIVSIFLALVARDACPEVALTIVEPKEFQVIQRTERNRGRVPIVAQLTGAMEGSAIGLQARLIGEEGGRVWRSVADGTSGGTVAGWLDASAGGWWRLEVRALHEGLEVARGAVAQVAVGEVFVVAGQSNAANHGEERQRTRTGRVAAFDGQNWRLANDPQPGASGGGGSFIPSFADAIVEQEGVPVGILACGIGATSVREWLPQGVPFPNPPTIESRVERRSDGQWVSRGAAYSMVVERMRSLGRGGFRAVLWHQGESDANQRDATRTLPGPLYREYLERLIHDTRGDIGWDAPWFVAQVSYHGPGDEGSAEIRAAQASLWADGMALEGPDSDALKGNLRERDGQGVHFSGDGLREHGARWAEKVGPWLTSHWSP